MAEVTPVEMTDRQIGALVGVRDSDAPTAKHVAEFIEPGSDARGAAQTLRRMPDYVTKNEDGEYKLTRKGTNLLKKLGR